jgi:hypothetical protein
LRRGAAATAIALRVKFLRALVPARFARGCAPALGPPPAFLLGSRVEPSGDRADHAPRQPQHAGGDSRCASDQGEGGLGTK